MPRCRPKLGQHFLVDASYQQRIAAALDLCPEDLVVEVGAGRGAMTQLLAERARRVVAIELDEVLAKQLQQELGAGSRIEVLKADILIVDLAKLCHRHEAKRCFVFGNLPYYITSPIVHHLFTFRDCIRAMALLVQREVAARLVAVPGSRDYGYLSVFTQLFSRPRPILGVPSGAFSPPPQVQSVLVGFRMGATAVGQSLLSAGEEDRFLQFVKRSFRQKRKNLLNNLAGFYLRGRVERELNRLFLAHSVRAEQLTLEDFIRLYRGLSGSADCAPQD